MSKMKAIGYGRKSFDDPQKEASSVADQQMFARTYAERNGFDMVAWFGDNYVTGATMERPGLQAMLAAFKRGDAEILIIEDVDRLSRDVEHFHYMVKLFRLYQVKVHTVAVGPVDDLVMSVQALMGEQQRKRIAYTTRRGLKGRAKRGGATGGKTLGYASERAEDDSSRLTIVGNEAGLVRRIFELYARGSSLKQICDVLNKESIPSPRARESGRYNAGLWNPSTLSGSVETGEGILNNELYVGRRIFNKRTWVEVPTETRGFRRQPRLNPESEWIVRDEPDLRIVDQDLWDRVKVRQQDARRARDAHFKITANPLGGAKRPIHILSGLVECGACGRPFLATGGGRWRCKGHRHGQCDNGSVSTRELEDRLLTGIRTRLLTLALVSRFAASLQKELAQAQKASNADRDRIEVKLGETRDRIARLVRRLEDEEDAPRALIQRLKALEEEEQAFAAALAAAPAATVIRLPANYEQHYLRAIDTLDECLASDDGATARDALRGLVERVVVRPGTARGGGQRPIQLHGDLFGMLIFAKQATAAGQKRKQPRLFRDGAVVTSLVAGTGIDQNLRPSQVEVVAGGRNHQNLRTQKSRPIGAADVRDLASQVEMVAGAGNHLNLLFRAAA